MPSNNEINTNAMSTASKPATTVNTRLAASSLACRCASETYLRMVIIRPAATAIAPNIQSSPIR